MELHAAGVYSEEMTRTIPHRTCLLATIAAAIALALAFGGAAAQAPDAAATSSVPPTKAAIVRAPVTGAPLAAQPLGKAPSERSTVTLDAGFRFNTVAALLHLARPYDPRLRLTLRTSLDGLTWQPWQTLAFVRSEGRPGTARRPDDTASQPLWIGEARFVQYSVTLGRSTVPRTVKRLRFVFINTMDGGESAGSPAAGAVESTTSLSPTRLGFLAATARRPAIVTRAGWGADESWRHWRPSYARVRMAFVHHTAGTTEYTRLQAPAIVRAVYYYHCKVLGWGDIGYNFLVDRYGTIYVGRYGGMRRGVIGAQVAGFNTHSTGVSMMGTFETAQPTPEMLAALERLLAWKLRLTRVDPLGRTVMTSHGGDRYAAGVRVRLRTISAHKDVGITACPGRAGYARMGQIRSSTWALMRRKPMPLYVSAYALPATITPNGDGNNDVATISCYAYSPATIRVAVLDRTGAEVRLLQDWTPVTTGIWPVVWDGTLPGDTGPVTISGPYVVKVDVTDAFGHTASATAKVAVNATLRGVSLKPAWFSPNGDAVADETVVSYTLDRDATTVVTFGPASAPWRIFALGRQAAGRYQIVWDGLDDYGAAVPDGAVRVAVRAVDDTGSATVVKSVAIDRVNPRPIAVEPLLRVKRNVRIDVPYRVRDRSTTTVAVHIAITRDDGTVVKDSDRGWVTTGTIHRLPFETSAPGIYTFTITAHDHAGNHEVAPALIVLTVR